MKLAAPSFWPEPRAPIVWQQALRHLDALRAIPDPWPCFSQHLKGRLSRRSVAGLYGLKPTPRPATLWGAGFLQWTQIAWMLSPEARPLLSLTGEAYEQALATWLVRRSPWVRLALLRLHQRRWTLPRGTEPLSANRQIRVGEDLLVGETIQLPPATILLGQDAHDALQTTTKPRHLSALHAPLYLLLSLGWLDEDGRPSLPPELSAGLLQESPAAVLRRLTAARQDPRGFIALAPVMAVLRESLCLGNGTTPGAWVDAVVGRAIELGAIEIHDWAPGQPRHGRGLFGDRDRKLVRWSIHDDFDRIVLGENEHA